MKTLFQIISFSALNLIVGFNVLGLFGRKKVFFVTEYIGLSYITGLSLCSVILFLTGAFGVQFSPVTVYLLLVLLIMLNLRKHRDPMNLFPVCHEEKSNIGPLEVFLIAAVLFIVCYTFFRALIKPIESYDSVAIWALKAKLLYMRGYMPGTFFDVLKDRFHGAHADYPLLVPFFQVWFYTFIDNFNEYLVKAIFPSIFTAFLFLFYGAFKRVTGSFKYSLITVFLLASVKQFNDYAVICSGDLILSCFIFMTFIYLYSWMKEREKIYLSTAVMSAIFAFMTKNEGVLPLVFIAIYLVSYMFKIKQTDTDPEVGRKGILKVILVLTAVFCLWTAMKDVSGVSNDVVNAEQIGKISFKTAVLRLIPVFYEYQKHVFGFKKWNLSWLLFFSVIIYLKAINQDRYKYFLYPIFAILAVYTCVYLVTFHDISWHLRSSASRLLLHVLPLAVFYIGANTLRIEPKGDR